MHTVESHRILGVIFYRGNIHNPFLFMYLIFLYSCDLFTVVEENIPYVGSDYIRILFN